jgi:hypothetical protein
MATTFTLPASGVPAKTPGVGSTAVTVYAELALTVAPVINDVYQMIKVPAGARILGWALGADDIDTNGSPAVTLSLGDGASTARYVSASTIGQTGAAPVDALLKTGYGFVYTTDDTIDILVAAAPATFAAGTIRCSVTYLI